MTRVDASTGSVLLTIAVFLLIGFLMLAVVCVLALLALRGRRQLLARRLAVETARLRTDLVAIVVGEEPDASEAAARLTALGGRRGRRADELLVGMLPKVRGHAKDRLRSVLLSRGAEKRALAQLSSGRATTCCRGVFALGAMGAQDATARIVPLLGDRSSLVRRVAVRSLGMMQDPAAVEPLLEAANRHDAVQRDLIQALIQLGPAAAPVLRARVLHLVAQPDNDDRSAPVAATALGFMEDVAAAQILAAAVHGGSLALQLAAAQALGRLDVPIGVPALQRAIISPISAQVQLAAATSLGRLGAQSAIPELLHAVEHGGPIVARTAASALLELGPMGHAALSESALPYAVEAVAVDTMRDPS
jgi:HEAT repeat protein